MRRALVAALTVLLLATGTAQAAPGTCIVEPNPVHLDGSTPTWTVTAEGGIQSVEYEIGLFQKGGVGLNDERRLALVRPDENGVVTWTFQTLDGRVFPLPQYAALWPGEVKVEMKSYRVGGQNGPKLNHRLATCTFTVLG